MSTLRNVIALLIAGLAFGPAALAQNFPNKPIRLITGNPGGANDLLAHLVAVGLSENVGQPVIVLNRPGSQFIQLAETKKAAPDGYTIVNCGANTFWLSPYLRADTPYDPLTDFAPVTLTASAPNMVVVHPAVKATTVGELIALAKAEPGKLNIGMGTIGSAPYFAAKLFMAMTNINMEVVPYKGIGQAVNGLMGGEVQVMFPTISTGMVGVKAGKLRALATTSEKRSELAPEYPTVAESGLPDYESQTQYAVFAPAKTPDNIVAILNRAIVKYLESPEIKKKIFNTGLEVVASSPQGLTAAMKKNMEEMKDVLKKSGIEQKK